MALLDLEEEAVELAKEAAEKYEQLDAGWMIVAMMVTEPRPKVLISFRAMRTAYAPEDYADVMAHRPPLLVPARHYVVVDPEGNTVRGNWLTPCAPRAGRC